MANILLGVSAGIASYKSADLASQLTQLGHSVRTLMTPNATRFIQPLTFRAVTGEPVFTKVFDDEDPETSMEHITLAQWGELLVIAPATADIIARLAAGLGDDILTTTALAFVGRPVVIAPAMNDQMWSNPIVQSNIDRLRDVAKHRVLEPESGHLACGTTGPGRLPKIETIIDSIVSALPGD